MSKKVGIVSCYFKNNYGSMLQAYATKKILDNANIVNETINIDFNLDFKQGKRKYYLTQLTNFKFIKNKIGMLKLKLDQKLNKELGNNILTRNKAYNEFRREFNISRSNTTYKDLKEQAKELYSDVIVGSDQLWLPVNVVSDYYTLNWVPDDINKISYATSFGFSSIPSKYNELYKKFLNRLNYVSTREESGVKIINSITDKNAKLVCDPTILLTTEEWQKEIDNKRRYEEKYIFCYFLGNNIEHRKFAERLKKETGYKIVSLNHSDEYVKYSDKFCDYAPYDIGPREWINLIANAEYVCTDSFHGTVFSILFNKMFFDFRRHNNKSKVSTNTRIDSLLDTAGISKERILKGTEDVRNVLKYKIDYQKVNENINHFRENSRQWLIDSISWKSSKLKYIDVSCKEDCCGCTACKNVCPVNAIEMKEDDEGFLYPYVDEEKCIKCSKCKRGCPILNNKKEKKFEQKVYAINNKDTQVRRESTSGGAFSAIATYVIENNGVVYGAAFDEKFNVKHVKATEVEDLAKYRNSKYVQSDLNITYKETKEYLNKGKLVLYSGTPCQIEGLKSFLQKDYENLILVDVVCRAVPSPKFLRKYLKMIKEKYLENEDFRKVYFRNKDKYGYKYTQIKITSDNNKYEKGVETDPYLRAFFRGNSIRPSCGCCKFKKKYRESDITLWDCFNVQDFDKSLDDNIGTTRVLVHSKKGQDIFKNISKKINYVELEPQVAMQGSKELIKSTKVNSNRKKFFDDMNRMTMEELIYNYFPDNFKIKVERFFRKSLVNLKLYKKIKKVVKRILKRG